MFKKFLARFGKGAATVDLRFENRPYSAGETVHGEVHIRGSDKVPALLRHMSFLLLIALWFLVTNAGLCDLQVYWNPLAHIQLKRSVPAKTFFYFKTEFW